MALSCCFHRDSAHKQRLASVARHTSRILDLCSTSVVRIAQCDLYTVPEWCSCLVCHDRGKSLVERVVSAQFRAPHMQQLAGAE